MKKFAIAAMAATMFAAPALADNSITYSLDGDVGSICGVYRHNGTAFVTNVPVNFNELSATSANVAASGGSATYRCNSAAGFTRNISSANNGVLRRDGSAGGALNEIAYRMSHGGGSGLSFTAQQLTASKITNLGGSPAFLAGQTGSVNFEVTGVQAPAGGNQAPGTTVYAGNYTDTVTIAVTELRLRLIAGRGRAIFGLFALSLHGTR